MGRTAAVWKTDGGRRVLADPFYYLRNFGIALNELDSRYRELFTPEERSFIQQFAALPEPSGALLVRMIMRRGTLFRSSRLVYAEIGATEAAAAPLLELGWIEHPLLDVAGLHDLLTKQELITQLGLPHCLRRLNKAELLTVLQAHDTEPRPFERWCPQLRECVFRPVVKPLAERLRLLFFGNFHQDWTAFIVSDLGISSYETVATHTAPFRTRAHIEAFYEIFSCHQSLSEGVAPDQIVTRIPQPITDSEWLEEHRQRLVYQVAMAYERAQNRAAAFAVHAACRHRGSRMRAVRLLEKSREWQAAYALCRIAESAPENEAERQRVRRVLPRLGRKLGIPVDRNTPPPSVVTEEVVLDAPPERRALELMLRDHLARQPGPPCRVYYVENALINSLFGLVCWDAIFAPLPGAFFHDFQQGPADLESPYFYERRREKFAACFAALESGCYPELIRRRLAAKRGLTTPFIAWGVLREPLLECALRCFPAKHLRLWFEWIVRDVVENRSGFPDLVQFWPEERRYRLVEVKGPGDRLQDNQRRFLEYCSRHQVPVAVCRVRW